MSLPSDISTIEIRCATERDIPELALIRWEFHQHPDSDESKQEFLVRCSKWLESSLMSDEWYFVIAAAPDNSIVGCAFLQVINKVPSPGITTGAWGYVTNSYIRSSHRSKGIGGQILEQIITEGKLRQLELLLVWPSVEAVSFYQRYGFKDAALAHDHPEDYPPMELFL